MFNKVSKTFQYGQHTVTIETGEIARQACGAVLVTIEDTVILATVVGNKNAKAGQDFFPLTVDYVERTYAAGKIPGGFFKREGKPSEKETLTSRLIDRPLRPLFPEGFYNEVQVIIHALSVNPEIDPDIAAMIGSSAALAISGIPFNGPIGAARVGYIDNQYVINPTITQMQDSAMDLVVAGTENAVLMVESEAQQLSEEIMLGGVAYGHDQMQTVINAIHDLVADAGKPEWDWQAAPADQGLLDAVHASAYEGLKQAYQIQSKQDRSNQITQVCTQTKEQLITQAQADGTELDAVKIDSILFDLQSGIVREQILSGQPRIDGRDTRTVRPIEIRLGVLPRAHGSALFTRGETQALVVTTLGTKQDEQIIDSVMGEYRDRFLLHYNFPPFSTGEAGRFGFTKRREIGHGKLAKRALTPLLPAPEDFQYTVRIVSEITESNGSSSMASICGGSLSMMDAGVPVQDHVAGIAMGLVKDDTRFAVLTDILGDEDHLGDMDFKVAGTENGITALQMDIKIQGITKEIMQVALDQAREGRLHILNKMKQAIDGSRQELSEFAPRMLTVKINPEKIRDVIGKGGATIRALTEETGTAIDISEEGLITISSPDLNQAKEAERRIIELTADVEVGQEYEGSVVKVLDFGAIVQILPGRDGLLHISEIANYRIANINDVISMGQSIRVKVIDTDDKGRIRLSVKAIGGIEAQTNAAQPQADNDTSEQTEG